MMINIRKIVLLSAFLISASSITAPTYAVEDDEQGGVSAPRVTHATTPYELTQDVISEIRQYGSFLAAAKEYVLQNPEQLEFFASYLNSDSYPSFTRYQFSYMSCSDLNYYIYESGVSQHRNPDYDPARPKETGPAWIWIKRGNTTELARLIFKEQDLAPAKPLAVAPKIEEQESESGAASSTQASSSADSSYEVDPRVMDLFKRYGDDRLGLANALAELWNVNLK